MIHSLMILMRFDILKLSDFSETVLLLRNPSRGNIGLIPQAMVISGDLFRLRI